ncbi:phosphomannomutase/phosphoglucomutase [candidate division KSB1 bacterium]|nr:phosphomannomutase/phosphoglucomutase [candidate division KSB1 bacterium]RQW05131.1 MAG: phosphomannomutase/phosphoglucomutase [candidate division KSB1 bacterium]
MNESIFRANDVRGIVERDFSDDVVLNLGKAYGSFMRRRGHQNLVVGHDLRLSSPHLAALFMDGLKSTGIRITFIGQVTTPALYFAIVHWNLDGGCMITGSHNPRPYNGFKMCEGLGSVYGDNIQKLKEMIKSNDFETGAGSVQHRDIMPEYIAMLKSKFTFHKKLKIVIDAGNATAGPIAPQLWREYGHEVFELYCEPDGNFPNHLPDPCVPKYMRDLAELVVREGADVGIGYDGDSDRLGAVDDTGDYIFADRLLALFARDVLKNNPGTPIIFDVKCSMALPEAIKKAGGQPVMWKTGHSMQKAKMKELGASFAGELSGHVFFKDDFFGFDDGIYASGRLLQIIANAEKKFSEIIATVPVFPSTEEIRVDCADEVKFDTVAKLVKDFAAHYKVIDVDGARVDFGDGWGLVRASNTEPNLVVRFEARTKERLTEIITIFKDRFDKYPEIIYSRARF